MAYPRADPEMTAMSSWGQLAVGMAGVVWVQEFNRRPTMKTFATTLLTMSALLAAPAFAEQAHHPEQTGAAAVVQAAPTFERMQDNLKIMQGQLQRAAEAKTDEERLQAMTEHMQTMRENMGMAQGMQGGMMNCPMMQGGMGAGAGAGMGMMGMMGGGAMPSDMGARMHSMEQRMDMMQMMMQRMGGPAGAGGAAMPMPK